MIRSGTAWIARIKELGALIARHAAIPRPRDDSLSQSSSRASGFSFGGLFRLSDKYLLGRTGEFASKTTLWRFCASHDQQRIDAIVLGAVAHRDSAPVTDGCSQTSAKSRFPDAARTPMKPNSCADPHIDAYCSARLVCGRFALGASTREFAIRNYGSKLTSQWRMR